VSAAIFALFVLNVTVVMLGIAVRIRRSIVMTKRCHILKLSRELDRLSGSSDVELLDPWHRDARSEMRSLVEEFTKLPSLPLARPELVLSLAFSALPLAAAIATLIATLK
jgi:hypothetical protein